MPFLTVIPEAKTFEFASGSNLMEIMRSSGLFIDNACGGMGLCGKCRVRIAEGRVGETSETELSLLRADEIAEGIRYADGSFVYEAEGVESKLDAFGHKQLSGVGAFLAGKINTETSFKARSIEFSTLQRCAAHMASLTDADEAYAVGSLAAQRAFEGYTGMMITIQADCRKPYIVNYSQFDIHEIANVERKVPGSWIINEGTYVSEEFIKYARPLISGELQPLYAGGVPSHITLNH